MTATEFQWRLKASNLMFMKLWPISPIFLVIEKDQCHGDSNYMSMKWSMKLSFSMTLCFLNTQRSTKYSIQFWSTIYQRTKYHLKIVKRGSIWWAKFLRMSLGSLKTHGSRRISLYFAPFNVRNGSRSINRLRWLEKSHTTRYLRGKIIGKRGWLHWN